MPKAAKRVNITHLFGGGWDTASGTAVHGLAPDASGVLRIPYLLDAENVLYSLNSGLYKIPGTAKLNASALESGADIRGLYDYWRQGVSGAPTQKRVVHVGTKVYKDDADGTFTEIASGLDATAVINYNTFDDLLIIGSDVDAPASWDQSTYQALAGSPPAFAFSVTHKGRVFAAGVDANPSHVYYCSSANPEEWSGGSSGSIQVDPGDGDRIVGLASHKGDLWVFKGPHKGSIHRITGSSSSDFALVPFIRGVGAIAHNAIFRIADDIGFMWTDGSVRLLSATSAYGDFREASLSRPIQNWLDEHLTHGSLPKAVAVTESGGRRVYFAVPIDTSTVNNALLVLDFGFTPARWSYISAFDAITVASVIDTSTGRPTIYFGGTDGYVRKFEQPTRSIDGGTSIAYKVTTPYIDYGLSWNVKTLAGLFLGLTPLNDGNITVGWQRDGSAQQTETIAQGGADVLGEFVLDTSTLGGGRFLLRFRECSTGGDFRAVQYQFTNSVNLEAVEIHSFGASLEVDAESWENL